MKEKSPKISAEELQNAENKLQNLDLGAIEEGDEEEETDSISETSSLEHQYISKVPPISFAPFEVAQAFSHFSYWATGRKRLICDLQGVYDEKSNKLMLSDPVIHYYNHRKCYKVNTHGRTDLGKAGITKFFATHECSKLCHLVTKGFRVKTQRKQARHEAFLDGR